MRLPILDDRNESKLVELGKSDTEVSQSDTEVSRLKTPTTATATRQGIIPL
jgi:hypothetical protein